MAVLTGISLPMMLAGATVLQPLAIALFSVPLGGTTPLLILAASI